MNIQSSIDLRTLPFDTSNTSGDTQSIVLVESDRDRFASLSDSLADAGYDITHKTSAQTALHEIRRIEPALAVVGLRLSGIDGLDVMQNIAKIGAIPTLVVVEPGDSFGEVTALKMGAADVVSSDAHPAVLVERIRRVLNRDTAMAANAADPDSDAVVTAGALRMDRNRHSAQWRGQTMELTRKEFALLFQLAKRAGVVFSREQIIDEVYGGDIHVIDRMVDSHVKRIRRKIRKVDPTFDGIDTIYGIGYRYTIEDAQNVVMHPVRAAVS